MLEVGTGFHPELTGRENVYMNGAILGMTKAEIDKKFDEIVKFAEMERFIDTPVKRYSSGMYVKLAFSVAAHLDSEIMIMDEVLAVGDMAFQKKCLDRMHDAAQLEGRTVLYVSHNMNTIRQLCNRCIVLSKGKVIFDGNHKNNLLEPTILDNVTFDDLVMQEEIFGPIMPIIEYQDLDKTIKELKTKEKPLALYIFSKNKININKVINDLSFGGGCVNDVIMHLTNEHLPFGGIGNSGMGRYHGKYSFDSFTHEKPIFKKGKIEIQVKYPPDTNKKIKLIKNFTKINK